MRAWFGADLAKILGLGSQLGKLTDARPSPRIPTAAAFASGSTRFATRRGSLNGWEQDLRVPARLRGIVGPHVPSADSIGRIYPLRDSPPLRRFLGDLAHPLKRHQALRSLEGWSVAAIAGQECFSSRKRGGPRCQKRTLTIDGQAVTESYHPGVVGHLIGPSIALVWEGE